MKKSKLLEIMGALDGKEMRLLEDFLRSPYFHKPAIAEDELRLFNYLHNHYPHFEEQYLQKDKVYQQIYPDTPIVKGKLEKRMSYLLKRIEQFMFLEEIKLSKDSFFQSMQISKFYRRKKLNRLYENNLSNLQKEQKQLQQKMPDDLLNEFLMQKEIADYQSLYNNRKQDINLVKTLKSLDDFYLIAKLEYACAFLSQTQFQSDVDSYDSLLFLEKLEPILREVSDQKLPLVQIFIKVFFILRTLQQKQDIDLQSIQELEDLLHIHEVSIPFDLLKTFHALTRNFYTRFSNKGHLPVREKIFSLYQEHLNKGYLNYKGGITPSVYQNIVSLGLVLEKFDWVYTFLQENKNAIIGANSPQDVYALNLANYHFRMKNYEAALDALVDHYEDMYYQIAAKRMEIKIYFEKESVLLDSKITAFRFFLRRLSKKKLPEVQSQSNNNFINALKQILLPKTFNNPDRICSLRNKIQNTTTIKEKEWLLEKLQ